MLGTRGICLTLVAAGLAVSPMAAQPAYAAKPKPSLVERLKAEADSATTLKTEGATGMLGFASTKGDLYPDLTATDRADAAKKATAYLDKYAGAFGAKAAQLSQQAVTKSPAGWTVDYAQTYQGLPVFGSRLRAHVDDSGDLTSVNGYLAPDLDLGTTPRITKTDARDRALRMVKAQPAGVSGKVPASYTDGLEAASTQLMVYRMGAIQGVSGRTLLAWVVEVTNARTIRETVVLDALTGKPVNRYSMLDHALDRTLIEKHNTTSTADDETVWTEGDTFPGDLDQDQQDEVQGTGEAYWFFRNTFGRDSYDGKGHSMTTVNNDPSIACPNANWNGTTTNYCSGLAADDVVAHEWGHAYTEYTDGLLYQWQPGAMNEAYSDIWGETVDLANARENDGDAAARTDNHCSMYTRGSIAATIDSPSSAAGPCQQAVAASFGPVFDKTGTTAEVVVGTDAADDAGPSTTDGCSSLTNASAVSGSWVYVDRGTCTFATKIANAQDAGATGIVFGNNVAGTPISVAGGPDDLYGLMVTQADGTRIKSAGGVTMTVKDSDTATKDDSKRWLIGEDTTAFGGAIRDMWMPTCYGNPGKVSDEEYYCDTDDNGGVHTNSGVVNHTYALLVDGGTYNGVTVPKIGLDKAANIFWQAQTNYLTPTSGFPELASALTQSCTDLVGVDTLKNVAVGNSATGGSEEDGGAMTPITATDCQAVSSATWATELTKEPAQCDFQPLLAKDTPSLCGKDFRSKTVWKEDFEGGISSDWSRDVEFFSDPDYGSGQVSHPWTTTTNLPEVSQLPGGGGTHPQSAVAVSTDPDAGSCAGDAQDESSRDGLISPDLTVPAGTAPKLSFEHYVATELGYDGGNVKVSVNGGDFEEIPYDAYVYNAPGAQLATLAQGSTDPMAGQVAFTGTDGGKPTGSWGTSIIDLSSIAEAGDTVAFRFDMGRDGCGGVDGWYLDNVQLTVCKILPTPDVTITKPARSVYGTSTKLRVKVDGATRATGKVSAKEGSRTLASGTLNSGEVATLALPKTLSVGRHTIAVAYTGDGANHSATRTVAVTVVKAAGSVTVKAPAKVRKGRAFSATVKVAAAGTTPTGRVTILKGKQRIGSGTLRAGKATIRLKFGMVGRKALTAKYAGSATVAAGSKGFAVRVVR
ncbi:M4 family metallopeptidase [Nocardioides cheoyonin]|uniref:M4 family metallopeptidase n=1 Tax=Nocardioides cheoyonin TaxID=3156615 RepID=UPI0032B35F31